jgi:xanthine/uracil permease
MHRDQAVISLFQGPTPFTDYRPDEGGWRNTNLRKLNMKSIVLVTALVAATAGTAFAQQAPVALSSAIQAEIRAVLPDADLSNLTNAQYAQLVSFFSNSENTRTPSDISQGVEAILTNAQ